MKDDLDRKLYAYIYKPENYRYVSIYPYVYTCPLINVVHIFLL